MSIELEKPKKGSPIPIRSISRTYFKLRHNGSTKVSEDTEELKTDCIGSRMSFSRKIKTASEREVVPWLLRLSLPWPSISIGKTGSTPLPKGLNLHGVESRKSLAILELNSPALSSRKLLYSDTQKSVASLLYGKGVSTHGLRGKGCLFHPL